MDKRGKEISPKQTVENAKKILDSLGLKYKIIPKDSGVNTFSHILEIYFKDIDDVPVIATNGKGVDEDYSLASAFSEMIERLSNMALTMRVYGTKFETHSGKLMSNNEKILEFKDVPKLDGYVKKCRMNYGKDYLRGTNYIDEKYAGKGKCICVPIININDGNMYHVPFGMLITDTNGMCAGNTKEEALCQGIFELFERFSHNYIMENKINVPMIPKEIYENTYSGEIIRNLENLDGGNRYKILIKDCSLGLGIPIVGIILIDILRKGYVVSFGASHNTEIALERCLTELLQNKQADTLILNDIVDMRDSAEYNNLISMALDGVANFPEEFISTVYPTCYFTGVISLGNNSIEIYENILKILKEQDIDIYYFDNSYLGMNCYKLISFELNLKNSLWDNGYIERKVQIYDDIDSNKLTVESAKEKLDNIFNENLFCGEICNFLGVWRIKDFTDGTMANLYDIFIAILLLKIGNVSGFVEFANKFLSRYTGTNYKGYSLLKCLVQLYSYQLKGFSLDNAVNILKNVYEDIEINECLSVMNNHSEAIKMFGFFDRSGQGKFNFCTPEFLKKNLSLINELNKRRIDAGM